MRYQVTWCFKWGIQKHDSKDVLKNSASLKNPLNRELLENKNEGKRELSEVDHRALGSKLDLFSISEEVGAGLILWHHNGTIIRNLIRDFWEKEHLKNGYQLVCTPHIARSELWQVSGHLDYYKDNMYIFNKEGEDFVVKPMNCPFHIQIYKAQPRSYRELPIKYAEWGTVYRFERSGTLHGLMRVRGFTQDDAHIFCAPNQVEEETLKSLDFAEHILRRFKFNDYRAYLSSRDPEKPNDYMGSPKKWIYAQNCLAGALKKKQIPYKEMPGEAVFYGPKIDLNIMDASGREWQCTTIQFDFNLPKRFNMTYVDTDGKKHQVFMIHRALLGAVERFFAILTEHCKGNFPTWLAPIQVAVLPVSSDFIEYAREIKTKLFTCGIRTKIDDEQSTIGYKIRQAELQKVPYMAIIGKQEVETKKIAVRKHGLGSLGLLTIQALLKLISEESIR